MTVVVVGSMAFDTLQTPFGKREMALGGSANYFSMCASSFTDVRLCAVVGDDFPQEHVDLLGGRGIDCDGLLRTEGKTFHWSGKYGYDLNDAQTLGTDLNVFADFDPKLPESYRSADTVFLANIDPVLQRRVLEQVSDPKLVAMDTMNFWIEGSRAELEKTVSKVHMVFVNDAEARQFSGEHNIVKAAQAFQKLGPHTVVIKRGEYGALLFGPDGHTFFTPAYPLEDVFDPTGAGDTFAGGFLGWVDKASSGNFTDTVARQAMVMGSVMASYVVEDFSFDRVTKLDKKQIMERWEMFQRLTDFHPVIDLS
jgi:sugar/nucleoside kinase (ribokinase family)